MVGWDCLRTIRRYELFDAAAVNLVGFLGESTGFGYFVTVGHSSSVDGCPSRVTLGNTCGW